MLMRLDLGSYLKTHELTAYRIAQESQGELAANTIYAMAKKPAQRIDLDTVSKIITVLGRIQQREVTIVDLLQITEEPQTNEALQRPAFNPETVKPFKYRARTNRPAASRPSEDIVAELRNRA